MSTSVQLPRRLRPALALGGLLLAAAGALAGCGNADVPIPPKLTGAQVDAALATTPDGLRPADLALEKEANTLLAGDGEDALGQLDELLAKLKGRPVVVNLWGEWCVPCKKELPVFQRVALSQRGKAVVLGVATRTSRAKTEAFLEGQYDLPYPSIFDPQEQVNDSVTGVKNIPKTYFYKPSGGKPFVHLGPYDSVEKLESDIVKYAS